MSAALMQQMRLLADMRAAHAALADEMKARRDAFDFKNADLAQSLRTSSLRLTDLECEARAIALNAYKATGSKEPAPGVEIKVGKAYLYTPADALAWAKETKLCLVPESLDAKAFDKIAKATPLPFVTVREDPKVFIATQLNASLFVEVGA